MKIWFILLLSIPCVSLAAAPSKELISVYQELCAKEQDPVKRQNYCHILQRDSEAVKDNIFRQDIAVG